MNTIQDIDYINDYLAGKNKASLSFIAIKPGMVNETTVKVIMDILTKKKVRVRYCGPALYNQKNVQIHYKEIFDKFIAGGAPFYPELEEYLTRGPIFGFIVESMEKGVDTTALVKESCGATANPAKGTMRHTLFEVLNLQYSKNENGIHATGTAQEAPREIVNFFSAHFMYPTNLDPYKNLIDLVADYQKNYDVQKQKI